MKSLEFTLSVSPCLSCELCPQSTLAASYKGVKTMSLDAFNEIIQKLPADCRVDFSGFSEPFLNRDAHIMMRTAARLGYEVYLYTTLMGLSEGMLSTLENTKFANVRLHVPDGRFLKIPKEPWLRQFNLFKSLEIPFNAMAMGPICEGLAEILAKQGVTVELPPMLSRGGNLAKLNSVQLFGPIRCVADRWHQNVVLPNGTVVLCCMDYGLTTPLGNLLLESYKAIEDRANVLEAEPNPPPDSICRKCEWAAPV